MMKQIFAFLFFALLFAALAWFVDVRFSRMLALQYQAQSFPGTQGRILSGKVVQYTGSKGRIYYRASFSYRYQVNGQTYEGRRYRYDGHPSFSSEDEANQMMLAHPPGSDVQVYYNPNDPADAVLSPSIDAQDVSLVFLFAPMNLLFLSLLVKMGRQINWTGRPVPVAGGVRIIAERMTTRVRLPCYQPLSLALWTAGILSIVAGITINPVGKNYTPLSAGLFMLTGIVVIGAAVYGYFRWRVESGRQDLVIDEGARMIELPLTYKRRERRPLAFNDVAAVSLEKIEHRRRSGVSYTYAPTLQLRDGTPQRLTDLSEDRAESFAAWLREKLGVPASTISSGDAE